MDWQEILAWLLASLLLLPASLVLRAEIPSEDECWQCTTAERDDG